MDEREARRRAAEIAWGRRSSRAIEHWIETGAWDVVAVSQTDSVMFAIASALLATATEADKAADARWCAALKSADWDGGVFHHDGRIYPWPRGFVPDCPATWAEKTRAADADGYARVVAELEKERDAWKLRALRYEKRVREIAEQRCSTHMLEWSDEDLCKGLSCTPKDRCSPCRCRSLLAAEQTPS